MALTLEGKDSAGRPRQLYADKIAGLSDEDLQRESDRAFALSGYARNNRRSDYHWMADACFDESVRRLKMTQP